MSPERQALHLIHCAATQRAFRAAQAAEGETGDMRVCLTGMSHAFSKMGEVTNTFLAMLEAEEDKRRN